MGVHEPPWRREKKRGGRRTLWELQRAHYKRKEWSKEVVGKGVQEYKIKNREKRRSIAAGGG